MADIVNVNFRRRCRLQNGVCALTHLLPPQSSLLEAKTISTNIHFDIFGKENGFWLIVHII